MHKFGLSSLSLHGLCLRNSSVDARALRRSLLATESQNLASPTAYCLYNSRSPSLLSPPQPPKMV
jgi:hypothetical protein